MIVKYKHFVPFFCIVQQILIPLSLGKKEQSGALPHAEPTEATQGGLGTLNEVPGVVQLF